MEALLVFRDRLFVPHNRILFAQDRLPGPQDRFFDPGTSKAAHATIRLPIFTFNNKSSN